MKKLLVCLLVLGLSILPWVAKAEYFPFDRTLSEPAAAEVFTLTITTESRLIKSAEHDEIFIVENGKKHWIQNWWTFIYVADQKGLTWNELLTEVEIINFEDLRDNYPIGATWLKKTVTSIHDGSEPREIFYPQGPPVTIRKMAILGTSLPGSEDMWKDLKGTHFYGNRWGWPDYELAEELGLKVFLNIRGEDGPPTEEEIRGIVLTWKDRPVTGGYWSDQLGHEPDITNPSMGERIRFYNTVRRYDPDGIQDRPVMEMMDMTEADDFPDGLYPGWKYAFSDLTHDVLLFDCYPNAGDSDEKIIADMQRAWDKFIKVYPHENQVIPQISVTSYRKGFIWLQYRFWNEKMSSAEFDNLFRGKISFAYYKDEAVRYNEEMHDELREINEEIMR